MQGFDSSSQAYPHTPLFPQAESMVGRSDARAHNGGAIVPTQYAYAVRVSSQERTKCRRAVQTERGFASACTQRVGRLQGRRRGKRAKQCNVNLEYQSEEEIISTELGRAKGDSNHSAPKPNPLATPRLGRTLRCVEYSTFESSHFHHIEITDASRSPFFRFEFNYRCYTGGLHFVWELGFHRSRLDAICMGAWNPPKSVLW